MCYNNSMKEPTHWNRQTRREECNARVRAYLRDLAEVGERHGLSLGHEDSHGAFIVRRRDQSGDEWLLDAHFDLLS